MERFLPVFLCISLALAYSVVRETQETHVLSPEPYEYIPKSSIPENFHWSDVNGKNYLSTPRQQHQPKYCGSCWTFCTTGSLSDRFNIQRDMQNPLVALGPQYILNCVPVGNCVFGDPNLVYATAQRSGLLDESCNIYQGRDDIQCKSEIGECYECYGKCFKVEPAMRYYVKEHGFMSYLDKKGPMEQRMQAEIMARGPISCEIVTTKEFHAWNSTGVFTDTTNSTNYDHCISVTGWGVENGTPFWWIRNSWGQAWGALGGFIKVRRGINNLGIESFCWWATPDMERSKFAK